MVVLGGVEYDIVFASEISDDRRLKLDLPARGTRCSCGDCVCENEADAGTVERPFCGCCLADCPDVHQNTCRAWLPAKRRVDGR